MRIRSFLPVLHFASLAVTVDVSITLTYKLDYSHRLDALLVDRTNGHLDVRQDVVHAPIDVVLPGIFDGCVPQMVVKNSEAYLQLSHSKNETHLHFEHGLLSICNTYTCSNNQDNITVNLLCPPLLAESWRKGARLRKADNGTFEVLGRVSDYAGNHPFALHSGDSVELHCTVFAYPPPNIRWYFDGKPLNVSDKFNVTWGDSSDGRISISTLHISDFSSADRGRYTCDACRGENICRKVYTLRYRGKFGWVWPVLGISVLVVLLAIIYGAFECSQKRKPR